MAINVQYGCGLSAPENWINFDASPTLRLQKIPLVGRMVKKVIFPPAVRYGDILKGLPGIEQGSCDAVYCSHVLEHLSYNDCKRALANTYKILKPSGYFRCVLPDLQTCINDYLNNKKLKPEIAAVEFMKSTLLGFEERPAGLKQKFISLFGNSHHLWMWDKDSLIAALKQVGFSNIRVCSFNDSEDRNFILVEDAGRFQGAFALEAIK